MRNQKHHVEFDLAHFNPKELEILDETQGGRTNFHKTPIRHFERLEQIMSDPKIERLLMKEYEHHAKGGRIGDILREADSMRQKGRKGDIDVAVIGPNTRRIFNKLMHGGSVNPGTGKAEYFNLGRMMKGIGHTISKGVRGLGSMATQALPGMIMGGLEGGPAGALAGGMGSMVMGGGGRSNRMPIPQNLGQMGQQFMNTQMGQKLKNQGQNMYNQANQHYRGAVNSPVGRAAMGAYNNMNGTNYRMPQSLGTFAQGAMNSSPAGQQMQQYGQNMYNQANQQYQGALNSPYGKAAQGAYHGYYDGMEQQNQQQGNQGGNDQGPEQGWQGY